MPLGKYYCDYCDKQFQDTPAARRRHLQGVVHQRAKALWYDSHRSSSQLGLDQVQDPRSVGKGVCNRFVRTGSCRYGDSCKYYHPKKNVENMSTQGMEGTSSVTNFQSRGIPSGTLHAEASLPGNCTYWKSNGNIAAKSTSLVVASSRGRISTPTLRRLGISVPPDSE
ncbi:Zinc finger CCCH domain-containing protein 3 [Sesamum alatum]|uniref:Zinc finger CCCH domain-containing protein 3 n=1 Tax=Sesamum alatum TaxID=300844 RepID=A0AAE1YDE9_9LAMI|nr:Zinc finger CCCH domain-containing protein 3 [Sesamum alatum]